MGEWKTYRLEELCTAKGSYGIGAPAVAYDANKYTYLRITDINDDGTLNHNGLMSVEDERAGDYLLKENDIVFARTGNSTGRTYFYDGRDGELVYAGFLIKFSLDNKKVNPRILKYYTHSQPYYDWVRSFDTGGTRGNINAKVFGAMPITLPPRHQQDRIVEILKSLDDKIELNRRINANLEAQAQALFRSWFVDFEPFRDGPFVDSELGKIPQGWKVLLFSDFCEHSTQKVEDRTVTEYSVTNSGMFPREQKYTKQLSQNISKDKLIRKRDLVFGMSREILNWGIMKNDQEGGVSAAYTIYHIKDEIDSTYLENYITFHKPYFKDLIKPAAREGQGIDKKIFENKILYYPPQNVLNNFFAIYNTLITNNQNEEIKTLSALRDTLLPKLMAGEINVE